MQPRSIFAFAGDSGGVFETSSGATVPRGDVNTALPRSGPGFYSYHPGSPGRQYGRADVIAALQAIGASWAASHPAGPRIGIGDLSWRGGGPMKPHKSHQLGVDVDVALMRRDGAEQAVTYKDAAYSRVLTQALVDAIRSNRVLGVERIYFNDPAVSGVRKYPGHDNHLHVRFATSPAPLRTPTPSSAPAVRSSDSRLAAAIARWRLPTGVAGAPTFHELVERWRSRDTPLALLVAFSSLEASGWNDATHGTPANHWTIPAFYELGMFQTPAGLHGACTSGRYSDCEFAPPGHDPHRTSPWFKIAHDLGLDPMKWTDPTTQVRIGLANLERDAATIRRLFPDQFPKPNSSWALLASVLLPFGPGIGYTRKLLATHRAALAALPEASRWAYLQSHGARTKNSDDKMDLARKLADAMGVSSTMPSVAGELGPLFR